jgi:hypothetical protein
VPARQSKSCAPETPREQFSFATRNLSTSSVLRAIAGNASKNPTAPVISKWVALQPQHGSKAAGPTIDQLRD